MRAMQVGHQGWSKKTIEAHQRPALDALGDPVVRPEDDPEDAAYVQRKPGAAAVGCWVQRSSAVPPTTSRRQRRRREVWEEDDEEDAEAVAAARDSWNATEAAAVAAADGIDLGALAAEAGCNGVGARLAAVRRPGGLDAAASPSEFLAAREEAMERGGGAVYAAVGYVTGEAIRAAKEVMRGAHATVPVALTQDQAREKRLERPDRNAWKVESLSTMKEKEESDKAAAQAATRRLHMLGRFVRMSDLHVADALMSIAAAACGCYGNALRAAGTEGRGGLFLVAGSAAAVTSDGADAGADGPVFSPAPLELCRLAEVVPEQICAMLAAVPGPSFAPDLAAWDPDATPVANATGHIAAASRSYSRSRGTNSGTSAAAVLSAASAPSAPSAHSTRGITAGPGPGAMGAAGAAAAVAAVERILGTITGRRRERIGLLRRRGALGAAAEDDHDRDTAAVILTRMRMVACAPELAAESHRLVSGGYLAAMACDVVVAYSESRALHAFALAWSPEEYRRRGPSADDYCTDVAAVKAWHSDISAAAVRAVCGPITVDSTGLKRATLPLAMATLGGMLELLRGERGRHAQDTAEALAADAIALAARPTLLDTFAAFLETAWPHFPAGEMRAGAAAALATAAAFDELLAGDPLAGMSSEPEPGVSHGVGRRPSSWSASVSESGGGGGDGAEGYFAADGGSSGGGVGASSDRERSAAPSTSDMGSEVGGDEEEDASMAPPPTLAALRAIHARYEAEAEGAREHVLSFAPLMASALEAAAVGARADLASVLGNTRAHPVTNPDASPADALKALAIARGLAAKASKAANATARQRLLLGVGETAQSASLSVAVEAAFHLLDVRCALWEGLARWYAFLAFLKGADVFGGEVTGRGEDFAREIAGAEAAMTSLEGFPDTLEVEDVHGLLPNEAALGAVLRARLCAWRNDQPVLDHLMHPAMQVRHWKTLVRGLHYKRERERSARAFAAASSVKMPAGGGRGDPPASPSPPATDADELSSPSDDTIVAAANSVTMPLARLLRAGLMEAPNLVQRVWRRAVAEAELAAVLEAVYDRWLVTLLHPQVRILDPEL